MRAAATKAPKNPRIVPFDCVFAPAFFVGFGMIVCVDVMRVVEEVIRLVVVDSMVVVDSVVVVGSVIVEVVVAVVAVVPVVEEYVVVVVSVEAVVEVIPVVVSAVVAFKVVDEPDVSRGVKEEVVVD